MRNLYHEYGDFVRTDTFAVLEGFGTQCTKSDFYDLLLPDKSLVFTRDKPMHDARRQVWSTALSASGTISLSRNGPHPLVTPSLTSGPLVINSYRPRIERQIAVLLQRISEAATTQSTVLVNDMVYWFTFDSMGEFAFNQDFGMMRRQEWHFAVTLSRRALSLVGPFSPAMWLIKIGFAFAPWFSNIRAWLAMLSFCNDQMEARTKTRPPERDIASYFIEEAESKGHSKNMQRWMQGDAATVIVAGSDTTAPQLIFLLYLIARNPDAADKMSAELADVDPMDLNAVSRLPHLNGVINEALRLYSSVPTAVSRQTPPQGVMLGDTWIPGDTKVIIPRWVISRREDCFVRADDFIPERWYSKPELVKHRRAFAPFGTGRASCVGQGLAMTQLRLVLASLVKRYHVRFPSGGQDGQEVLRDMKDQLTAKPGELRLTFQCRDVKTASS
ncbi:MAG: hypothetical protein Q9206_003146 [Seirophora lacunosa]